MVYNWRPQYFRKKSREVHLRFEKLEDRSLFSASPGLVAAWGFEEASGNVAADASGNSNVGTIDGAVWSSEGRFGNALAFDGTGSMVTVGDAASLDLTTGMTLEAWVRPDSVSDDWGNIINRGSDFFLVVNSDPGLPAAGWTFSNGGALYGAAVLEPNIWSHVAMAYDGAMLRLYVNGVQVANLPLSGSIATSNVALTIGGDPPYGQFFDGSIDEVRIYNRALSATEIHLDMNAPVVDSSAQMNLGAPLVYAGPDITVDLIDTALLSGEAMSIALQGLAFGWNKSSGPGIVTFGDPYSPVSTARFSSAGVYELTLTVSNFISAAGDRIVVTVVPENVEEVLATNQPMTIDMGATGTISSALLTTTDVDDTTAQLVYTITSGPSNGTLKRSGAATTSFTQADINAGLITYQHNGGETTSDSFAFSVNDGQGAATTGTFLVSVTPTVSIPELDTWLQDMLTFGRQHGEWLLAHQDDPNVDPPLGATYYDAARVFYQIADYTGDDSWNAYAEAAVHVYRDRYVVPNNGGASGHWNFTRGLVLHYERTGDIASKNAAILLSHNASYAGDLTPMAWMVNYGTSREVAYAINDYLDEERLGEPRRDRLDDYVELAKGHLDQWINGDDDIYAPFMFGLTADALIEYYTTVEQDPEILTKIQTLADWTWDNTWVPADQAFIYRLPETAGAPDLNLLICPLYEWLYQQTGVQDYRDKADAIFAGGVAGAYLNGPKQFNQNYRVSFDYVAMRQSQPNALGQAAMAQQVAVPVDLIFTALGTSQFELPTTTAAWSAVLESDEMWAPVEMKIALATIIDTQSVEISLKDEVQLLDFSQLAAIDMKPENLGIDLINLLAMEVEVPSWLGE